MALARLWGAAVLLLGVPGLLLPCGALAASSHSLHYFYTGVSEPGQGLPRFVQVGYVDDQPITHYDSSTRRKRPAAPWMEKVGADDPQYWERGTRKLHSAEQAFRESLATLQGYHNQSGGKLRGAISFIEEEQRARELLTQQLNKLQTTSSSTLPGVSSVGSENTLVD